MPAVQMLENMCCTGVAVSSCIACGHGGQRVGVHSSSASSTGPVETGFKKDTASSLGGFLAVLARSAANTVFPTSVLSPKTWYTLRERQRSDATGDFMTMVLADDCTHHEEAELSCST